MKKMESSMAYSTRPSVSAVLRISIFFRYVVE